MVVVVAWTGDDFQQAQEPKLYTVLAVLNGARAMHHVCFGRPGDIACSHHTRDSRINMTPEAMSLIRMIATLK